MNIKRIVLSDMIATSLSVAVSTYIYWFTYDYFSDQAVIAWIGLSQLVGILLSTLGGGFSDKMNKLFFIKTLMISKVLLFISLLLLQSIVDFKLLLLLFMLLSAIIGGFLSPSLESLLPFLIESDEELYKLNAQVSSLTQLASVIGGFLSVLLISSFSFSMMLYLSIFFSSISLLLLIGVEVDTPIQTTSIIQTISQGVTYIARTAYIRDVIPVALLANFSFWSIFLILPKVTSDYFGFFRASYSLLELMFSFGGIFGGWIFAKYFVTFADKYSLFKKALMAQSITLLILGFNLFIFRGVIAYALFLVIWFSYAALNTIFSIIYFGHLQSKTPKKIIGSVFGTILTLFSLINPLAAIASNPLVIIFSPPVLIILMAILMLMAALLAASLPSIEDIFN